MSGLLDQGHVSKSYIIHDILVYAMWDKVVSRTSSIDLLLNVKVISKSNFCLFEKLLWSMFHADGLDDFLVF